MKLQLISDLHTEFYYPDPMGFCSRLNIVPDLDFLVIAGDLVVPMKQPEIYVQATFDYFATKARHVIYVDGNHEYYGGNPTVVQMRLTQVMPKNFHWLMNTEETIDGVHFYGGAMWFHNNDQMNFYYRKYMNDFHQIGAFEPWVYEQNKQFTDNAKTMVRPETIVVTHHLPHSKSTPPEFAGDQLNRFFCCDQTAVIEEKQPRLWFHGHTHRPCDYTLGNTRVVCNPHGYPREVYRPEGYVPVVLDV